MSCRKIARAVCMAAAAVMVCAAKAEDCVVTNVAPLINSRWTQGAPYNDYSPLGWVAGCVATAGAQEFRYWQWPWSFDGVRETSHPVAGNEDSQIRFDGHVPFEWDAMQDSYSGSESLASRHAAARLELFVQSLVQMNFISGGAMNMKSIVGATDWYEFDQTVKPYESAEARDAVLADLQWGSPMQVGLNVSGYGGHEGVGVGYGESADGKPLLAINLGWGGDVQWWDLTATSGNYVKDAKIGFRPIKSVQIEPVAPVSGSDVTIKWHLPNCYTNKVSGFTVAKKTVDPTVVTWSDDFSDGGKGRSSNSGELTIVNDRLYGWQGQASGTYTYDEVFFLTANSVLSYQFHDDYMAGMSVRIEAKIGNDAWRTIDMPTLHEKWNYDAATTELVDLSEYAGKSARFRIAVEFRAGGVFSTGVNGANAWFDDFTLANVCLFSGVESTVQASERETTFTGLESGEFYALCVTPIMADSSKAVTQTVTTTIGTPAATPEISSVSMKPRSTELMQEDFYTEIAMGWNVLDVECANTETLEAFSSHQSALSQETLEAFSSHQSALSQDAITIFDNGGGSFSVQINATDIAQKWNGQRIILTLKATNSTGESVYKDLELRLMASGVPENFPDMPTWIGEDGWNGENYTDKWVDGVLPSDGTNAIFYVNDGDFGAKMKMNLGADLNLDYLYVTGLGQLTIAGTSSGTLTAGVLKNDVQVEIDTTNLRVGKAVPSANVVIDSGSSLDCEIDQSLSGYVKKVNNGYTSALTDSALWNGTVVFSSYTAANLNLNTFGNTASSVRFNGVAGHLTTGQTYTPEIVLVDNGTTAAFDWNNGSTGAKETFKKISGDGTFKTSGTGGAQERVVINDIDDFTGSFDLSLKRIVIGNSDPTTTSQGSLTVNSGEDVTVAAGKTWTASGGFFLKGSQTITVNGTLNGAITAEGTGTTLALASSATVTASTLTITNNTVSLAMTADAKPSVTVTGAADLTDATIAVSLAEGMTVGDSVALMSAGSFTGVDSATLTGLGDYELEVSDGVLYAKAPVTPVVEAPEPIAVWVGDFDAAKDGCTLDYHDNVFADGAITIAGGPTLPTELYQGVDVNLASPTNAITVIVKYSNLAYSTTVGRVFFTSCADSEKTHDRTTLRLTVGNRIKASKGDNSGAATIDAGTGDGEPPPSAGYMAFSYDGTTLLCSGVEQGAIDTVNFENEIGYDADANGGIYGATVGGLRMSTRPSQGWDSATGMKIRAIAVFGKRLTEAERNAYRFPAEIPGTVSMSPVSQSNVSLDINDEWAVVADKPIYVTLDTPTNILTVAFDAYVPSNVTGTLFSWDSTKDNTRLDSRVVITNDASKAVIWRKTDGTLSTVGYSKSTLIPSGEHNIILEWTHNAGADIYVDGEKYYSSTSLKFSNYNTTTIALGGAVIDDPVDLLSGLKVKNLTFFGGRYDGNNFATVNGTKAADIEENLEWTRIFELTPAAADVTFAVGAISVGADEVSVVPDIDPAAVNASVVLQGSTVIGAAADWSDVKMLTADEAENGVTLDATQIGGCRFFKLVVR